MRLFLDTSAWIKYFIAEAGSREIQAFLLKQAQHTENVFHASAVTYAEMYATFTRAKKAQRLTGIELTEIEKIFEYQWRNIVLPTVERTVILQAGILAKSYGLRGCDAFQLSSALAVPADLFICCDNELNNAARQENLQTWNPTEGLLTEILARMRPSP